METAMAQHSLAAKQACVALCTPALQLGILLVHLAHVAE
jgi:hypothetical protein